MTHSGYAPDAQSQVGYAHPDAPPQAPLPPGVPGAEAGGEYKPQQVDYFGFAQEHTYTLPDGVSQVFFVSMNEGAKAIYQRRTNSDVVLERGSGNARMKVDQATARHELIRLSVKGWNFVRGSAPYRFTERALSDFLNLADPAIVAGIEKAIRDANPWLLAESSSAELRKERDNLDQMIKEAEEREAGEASSSNR